MIRFLALGSLELTGDRGEAILPVLSQPKRTALLAYLAFGGRDADGPISFHRRDTLLALFWPESDEQRARNALNTSLSYLRRALGPGVVVSRGEAEVGADPARLWCDVTAFRAALREGDTDRALALYRGELLPGFGVPGAGELQRWLDDQRAHLEAAAVRAAIEAAERGGGAEQPSAYALRATALAPTDERAARALMTALHKEGRRAGALEEFERLSIRVAEELGVGPSPETVALARSIADADARAFPVRSRPRATPPSEPPAEPSRRSPMTPPAPSPASRRRRSMPVSAAAAAAAAALLLAAWALAPWNGGRSTTSAERLVILPFGFTGDDAYAYLAPAAVHLLSAGLHAPGVLDPVEPNVVLRHPLLREGLRDPVRQGGRLARRLKAGRYVVGEVVEAGGELRFQAVLYDAQGRERASAMAAAADESTVFGALDRLAGELLVQQQEGGEEVIRAAARTTGSLPALKTFMTAELAYREGRYEDALAAVERALVHDSLFALAHFRRSALAAWTGHNVTSWEAMARAWALRDRLPDRERRMVEAARLEMSGHPGAAERVLRDLVARHPHTAEAWARLAELRFHSGDGSVAPDEAEATFRRVAELDPGYPGVTLHLARLAAHRRDRAALETLVDGRGDESGRARPDDHVELRALRAFTLRDPAAMAASVAEMERLPDEALVRVVFRTIGFTGELVETKRLVSLLRQPIRAQEVRSLADVADLYLDAAGGRDPLLHPPAASASRFPRLHAVGRGLVATTSPVAPDPALLEALRRELEAPAPPGAGSPRTGIPAIDVLASEPHLPALLHGLLSVRLGDPAGADSAATRLEAGGHGPRGPEAARIVRAALALSRNDPAAAHRLLGERASRPPLDPAGIELHLRARTLALLGRHREALRLHRGFIHDALYGALHLAESHYRSAELLESLGEADAARHYWERFLELWPDPDPSMRPWVERAAAAAGD